MAPTHGGTVPCCRSMRVVSVDRHDERGICRMKKHSTDTGNGVPADLNPDESRLGERTEFMTRAGRWCNGSTPPPVGGDPGSNPVASAKESASDTVCGFLFAVLAQWSVLQSSKLMMRVRFPYTARYDSMPVGSSRRGSHDHAGRVRWFTPPFVRRTREYRQRPSSYGWMMRTALCRKGWCESDKAYPPSAGKVSWNAGDCVSCQPTHRMWERSRGAWGFSPRDPCHASCCSMRVHRKHECRIRHEWSNPQWTARAYPCGLPAHAFVAQPVEAMRQGRIQSGFESRRKHWRKRGRQRRPYRS